MCSFVIPYLIGVKIMDYFAFFIENITWINISRIGRCVRYSSLSNIAVEFIEFLHIELTRFQTFDKKTKSAV